MRIGDVLKKERKKRKLMRNEVCKGICTPSTYGRYENLRMEPNKIMVDALLERLGRNPERIAYYASVEELEFEKIRRRIDAELKKQNIDYVKELLEQYIKLYDDNSNRLHEQYILRTKAIIEMYHNKIKEAVDLLVEALLLTKELDFMYDDKRIFTVIEMEIIIYLCSFKYFDENLLYEIYYYISELDDRNIIKLIFFDKVLMEIVDDCAEKKDNQKILIMIEDVLNYKKRVFQFNGLREIIICKKKLGGEVSYEEEKIIGINDFGELVAE